MPEDRIRRITHPTDFTRESEIAFNHALRLAVATKAELDILHVAESPQIVASEEFPSVPDTLRLWGMRPEDGKDGFRVQKVSEYGKEPVQPILEHLDEFPAELIVLATHRREGLDRWLHREVAQKIARNRSEATLFVPCGVQGFVSPSTGGVTLRQIVVPVDWDPKPQAAVDAVVDLAAALGCVELDVTLLHVGGDQLDVPPVQRPQRDGWSFSERIEAGEVVDTILAVAKDCDADLIAMATQGHDGFLDALRGSNTERVLRQSKCPVLSVPGFSY